MKSDRPVVGTASAGRRRSRTGRRLSSDLIEAVVARSLAAYCLLFGLVTLPGAFAGQPLMNPVWAWVAGPLLFASTFALLAAGLLRSRSRLFARLFAGVFLLVLATWPLAPLAPLAPHLDAPTAPWPWPLANVAIAAAAFSFRPAIATAYTLVVPAIYVGVRILPAGGGVSAARALSDGGYAVILGAAILLLITMLRKTAVAVERAHGEANDRYEEATSRHQTELERVQVDAIVHDSVLTTFLTAARAYSESERQFAVAMAKHALSEVAATKALPGVQLLVSVDDLRDRFESACADLGIEVDVQTSGAARHALPLAVIETIFAAALQALANSVQHAGGGEVHRTVLAAFDGRGVSLHIRDDGLGFDTATMTPGRLGVRVSIIERVHAIGGHAHIDSQPGVGTTVHIAWPGEEYDDGDQRDPRTD